MICCTNLGYSCPSGYTWKIGFCSSINDCTNLGYSCPSGYTWKIGFCSSINDCTNLGYSCPSGYTWKIGSCTSISDCTNLGYSCPSGYTWTIGSCTSISDCTNLGYSCPSGYTWTIGSCTSINDCSQTVTSTCPFDYNFSLFNRWMAFIMWSAIIIIFIIDLIDGYLSDCYPSGLFTWLEHIQLFTILPLAGSCFSSEVNGFFRLASYSLLGFNFINIKEMFSIGSDYSQDNKVLSSIGFSSSSTIINIGGYLIIGLLIVIGEVIVCILYRYKYQNSDDGNINANWCAFNLTPRLKQWIWFGAPIRYLLLGLVLVNTAGIEELNSYSDSSHRWSWWFAWFILFVFPFMFNCTVLYAILSKSHQDLNESNVFSELVSGLKNNRVAKLYSLLFMIHRILVVMFVTIDMGMSTSDKLISLIWVQSAYLIALLLIRPFSSKTANINKIVWEYSILILLLLMISDSTKNEFVIVMTINSWIPLLISISNVLK